MRYKLARLNDAKGDLNKQWFVYYSHIHPETEKFQRFRKTISLRIKTATGRRKRAAEIISEINTRLKKGWNPFEDGEKRLTNVIEALEFVVKLKGNTVGKRSFHTYRSISGMFIKYLEDRKLNGLMVDDMSKGIAQDYFDHVLMTENISARTYNNRVSGMGTLFNALIKRDFLQFNPFEHIDRLRETEPEITAYTNKELDIITRTLPKTNFQLYAISQLIFYCFIRPAELVRLQFDDLLWDKNMIIIPGHKSKNKKTEVIIIPEQMKKNLEKWNLNYPAGYYIFSKDLQPGEKEVAPTRIAEAWREYADKHGIKKGVYDFKHTGNGFAFDAGLNARDIQLQNRHSSLEQTQIYLNKFRRVASNKFKREFTGY